MHAYIHADTHAHARTHNMHSFMPGRHRKVAYGYVCTHTRTHARAHTHAHTHTQPSPRTRTHTRTHTCTRTCTHTHTHTHRHAESDISASSRRGQVRRAWRRSSKTSWWVECILGVCVYAWKGACMHGCMHVCLSVCVCMHVRLCVPLYVRMHARMHASGTHVDITLHTQIPSAVAQIGSRLKKRPANLLEVHIDRHICITYR